MMYPFFDTNIKILSSLIDRLKRYQCNNVLFNKLCWISKIIICSFIHVHVNDFKIWVIFRQKNGKNS